MESQEVFGNSWFSWVFLLFLLWSNSRLSLKAKSYLLALQGYSWNTTPGFPRKPRISSLFQAFPGFLEAKKHGKAKKARSSWLFFALQAFFLQGGASFLRKWDWVHLLKERCLNLTGVYVLAQVLYFLVW